ncbi:hypothetical protein COLU111180_01420 [Cohnella lubricantis]|uniref:Uncharacterized protein n=1 Tax=Cohnella lubricantis TaxID=2163172 RepID=A0A841THA6_9BACL|nr:hypothetical protein [Cohnella lubricantis]MBB6679786.1 hypothetical protein [Cohnella lubricantis]MBP2120238.1 hypothetical protein [Cohnella lubricantis]
MAWQMDWRKRRLLSILAYLLLALWCMLEWLGARPAFILNPLGLIAYVGSVCLCLVLSTVLFLHSPRHRLLTAERIAASLLLVPLLWNLI